jgi:hypothetical protein
MPRLMIAIGRSRNFERPSTPTTTGRRGPACSRGPPRSPAWSGTRQASRGPARRVIVDLRADCGSDGKERLAALSAAARRLKSGGDPAVAVSGACRLVVASSATRPRLDAPGARERSARFEADQGPTALEGVRGAGHRLDGETAPGHIRQGITAECHQVAEGGVGPQGDAGPALGVEQFDPGQAVPVALQVRARRRRRAAGRSTSTSRP